MRHSSSQELSVHTEIVDIFFTLMRESLDVLVIYHVRLNAETVLPAQVHFRLPDYLEDIHAIAVERDGRLVNVDRKLVEQTRDERGMWLTFPVSSLHIQLEYYDPVILSKHEQTRRIRYAFSVPSRAETAIFKVQHPVHAEDVILELDRQHEPLTTDTGRDGLQYSMITLANLTAGETFKASATYTRNTSELSRQHVQEQESQTAQAENTTPTSDAAGKTDPFSHIIVLLIGAGAASLLWWLRGAGRRRALSDSDLPKKDETDGE